MKISNFFTLCVIITSFLCCDTNDDQYETIQVATPEVMSKADFRKQVEIIPPKPSLNETGKIYAYKNYIFIADTGNGVQVIDNTNPKAPSPIAFIKILANEDIAVKDNVLYADNATDLLAFDISNINNIVLKHRLEDVFEIYNYQVPENVQVVDYNNFNYEKDIIVGWQITTQQRKKNNSILSDVYFDGAISNSAESTIGTGGSLARFQIVDNYLYTVGSHQMAIFNIKNLKAPVLENTQYAGQNIETLFQADNYLYLGSTNGMYIYSIENPSAPELVSEFRHWESCDPVVVDGNYAYLTLRGGNACGQMESVLEVIDISKKTNPLLVGRYTLDNPYGLGVKGNILFVCDGTSGLKLFDKSNPLSLILRNTINNIQAKDVIPLENTLLLIGNTTIYQYGYTDKGIELLSSLSLN